MSDRFRKGDRVMFTCSDNERKMKLWDMAYGHTGTVEHDPQNGDIGVTVLWDAGWPIVGGTDTHGKPYSQRNPEPTSIRTDMNFLVLLPPPLETTSDIERFLDA